MECYEITSRAVQNACTSLHLQCEPKTVYADFERSIHLAVKRVWPAAYVRGCKFHLGQAWWRKIQALGLANEYSQRNDDGTRTDTSRFLGHLFGLSFLKPVDVEEFFFANFVVVAPSEPPSILQLLEYLHEWYIKSDATFPPTMWAEMSASMSRTTNACESFHANFNANFYSPHPNIFSFLDVLKNTQFDTEVLLNSAAVPRKFKKATRTKQCYIRAQIEKYEKKKITAAEYVQLLSYKSVPVKKH